MNRLGNLLAKLVRPRTVWLPTWRGWVVLVLLVVFPGIYALRHVCDFLTLNEPLPDAVPVVEGWITDDALHDAIQAAQPTPEHKIYVTGGPVDTGDLLVQYGTLAEMGAATLIRYGVSSNAVQAVPAPRVLKDRTFTSARALREWFLHHGGLPPRINLICLGPHSRRSHLLFAAVFEPETKVGVIGLPDRNYDPKHWWRTSKGFRTVTDEIIAYFYARFLFSD